MQTSGLVAVVTGGASGLGEATVRRLLTSGAAGVAILDLDETRATALVDSAPSRVLFVRTDVADESAVDAAVAVTVARFGAIHLVVNAAAIGGPAKLVSKKGALPMATFDRVLRINLYGVMHVLRAAVPAMMKNVPNGDGERGVVINVSSGAAWEGQVGQLAYSASKAALLGLTMPLMRELAEHGIRVCAVAPGLFDTPIYDAAPAGLKESLIEQTLFPKRMGKADEFASFVDEIVRNPMHNGRNHRLDAGMSLRPAG